MSQQADASQQSSGWSKTKSGFSSVGKGANAARSGINNSLGKLDNMSISSKGVSFKKNLSGGNINYDRDNHIVAPKMDVSHLPPPPKRIPGATPPPSTAKKAVPTATRPNAPQPAANPGRTKPSGTAPVPPPPRPNTTGRAVPPPPPSSARPNIRQDAADEPLPVYTPVVSPAPKPAPNTNLMGDLSSRFGSLKTGTQPASSKNAPANSIPSMGEASTAMNSAKTVGGLYSKYGNQTPGQKTATPTWAEVKAGASAAQNLHAFHGKYAPKQNAGPTAPSSAATTTPTAPVAQQTLSSPSPKPPLPKGKPQMGPRKVYCVGLFAFEAQTPGDLSFQVGDKIEVLERTSDPDAWWKGRLDGVEGIFPANYCRLDGA